MSATPSFRGLAEIVDAVNDATFFGRRLSEVQRKQMIQSLAKRQGLPGSYAGMFAPTEADFSGVVRVFTGEAVRSRAAKAHILGEEACRTMIVMHAKDAHATQALANASRGMVERLGVTIGTGMYCCGICSCSLWRHLAAGGLDRNEARLMAAMKTLKQRRKGSGEWSPFPFYYTLLTLLEIDLTPAKSEMKYAADRCERLIKRRAKNDDVFAIRRRTLLERVLQQCNTSA